jgi:hypothetical protein
MIEIVSKTDARSKVLLTKSNSKGPGHFQRACIRNISRRNTLLSCGHHSVNPPPALAHDGQCSFRYHFSFNICLVVFPIAHPIYSSSVLYSYLPATNILPDAPQQAPTRFESELFDLSHLHPTTNHTLISLSSGTIFMKSEVSPVVPILFAISRTCPTLSADFACLVIDVGHNLIRSHRESSEHWPPFEQF